MIRNLMEALPISTAKKYMKISGGKYKSLYPEIFKDGKDRQYYKYKGVVDLEDSPIYDSIKEYLKKLGYEIVDYKKGFVKDVSGEIDKSGKQQFKIGKLLKDKPEMLKAFSEDPIRGNGNFKIVISRHPYDIAGMTSDRAWKNTSCMNLTSGCNRRYVDEDIKVGTLVAYMINKDDDNIEKPYSRVLIKPYKAEEGEDLYLNIGTKLYGVQDKLFRDQVKGIIDELYNKNKDVTNKSFVRNPKLYDDYEPAYVGKRPGKESEKIAVIRKCFELDDTTTIKQISANYFECDPSIRGENEILVLSQSELRPYLNDQIEDYFQQVGWDYFNTVYGKGKIDNYITDEFMESLEDEQKAQLQTELDNLLESGEQEFLLYMWDNDILEAGEYTKDEETGIITIVDKKEVTLSVLQKRYRDKMMETTDAISFYKEINSEEEWIELLNDNEHYLDKVGMLDYVADDAVRGYGGYTTGTFLSHYDGEENYATVGGNDYYLYLN